MAKKQLMGYAWAGDVCSVTTKVGEETKVLARFDFGQVPADLDGKFMQIGRRTKLGNFAVDCDTVSEKLAAMREGFEMLIAGQWEKESGGRSGPVVSVEAEAIAKLKSITVAQAQKTLALLKKEDEVRYKALLASPKVQAEVDRIRAERKADAEDGVDLDDLIEE